MDRELREWPLRRHSFILVLWEEMGPYPHGPPVWRISLENTQHFERQGFKDLAELISFLEQWTARVPDEAAPKRLQNK